MQPLEAAFEARRDLLVEDLETDHPAQLAIACPINFGHAALPCRRRKLETLFNIDVAFGKGAIEKLLDIGENAHGGVVLQAGTTIVLFWENQLAIAIGF